MKTALVKKEFKQILRDPSTFIIAFFMPFMLLFIYMFGLNLDTVRVSVAIKNENPTQQTQNLVSSFNTSKYVNAKVYDNRKDIYRDISRSKIVGAVIIPNDFSKKLSRGQTAEIQVITDGSEVNLANYVQSYASAITQNWLSTSKYRYKMTKPLVVPEVRYWYNQEINSHYFIMPGSLAVTMTLIGILLTALVIAREWERGTMEALLTTRATKLDIILSKYIPYFTLGILSMLFSVFMCSVIFKIPFRGNLIVLVVVASAFLFTSLGIGLFISTNFKNQFLASQASLAIGFLPALMLSGLMFPINSMPTVIQYFTTIIPARYFVQFIQSEFMAGTVPKIVVTNLFILIVLSLLLFIAVYKKTKMRLDQ